MSERSHSRGRRFDTQRVFTKDFALNIIARRPPRRKPIQSRLGRGPIDNGLPPRGESRPRSDEMRRDRRHIRNKPPNAYPTAVGPRHPRPATPGFPTRGADESGSRRAAGRRANEAKPGDARSQLKMLFNHNLHPINSAVGRHKRSRIEAESGVARPLPNTPA